MRFQTHEFPTAPEGDRDLCNGQPGSQLAKWLRTVLADSGIPSRDVIQEDYGWGFWLESPAAVWVAVGFTGGEQHNEGDAPEWDVSVHHEAPFFAPSQWFKKKEGRELAQRASSLILDAVTRRDGITLTQQGDD